mgnify:CR=1 FL=1
MTCKINADTTDGLKIVSDTSGAVDVQSNGTTRMTVLANGNVGIGATSPTTKLDIAGSMLVDAYNNGGAGNGIFLRGGFLSTAQPSITVADHNGSAPDGISINGNDGVSFRTTDVERARINTDGELLIGTTTNTANTTLVVQGNSGVNSCIGTQTNHTGSNAAMYFMNTNGIIGSIVTSGSATAFNTSSDYRLKENVTYTFDATTRLKQLKPARFNFKTDSDLTVDGFLAHEVSSIVPEAITGAKDATKEQDVYNSDGEKTGTETVPDYQSIDQSKLVPLLVKTIQELEARITALES